MNADAPDTKLKAEKKAKNSVLNADVVLSGICRCSILCVCFCVFVGRKAEDNETFKTMVQFECRGLEPVDFQPQVS